VLYDPYTKQFQPGFKYCKPCPPTKEDTNVYSPGGGGNFKVIITDPDNGDDIPSTYTVKATVTGPNTIVAVEFCLDNSPCVADTSSPYSRKFTNMSPGNHEITVRAYDDSGNVEDDSINIKVVGGFPLMLSPPN
jgi:hypothetical protein